jgi:phosphate transport system protein
MTQPEVRSRGALDRDERQVKDGILRLGSLVESQIRLAIRALVERDASAAREVVSGDALVNGAQRVVTDEVAMTIATQSPVARDLRFLLALNQVSYELERIGDHATSVAKQVERLSRGPALPQTATVARMGTLAAELVHAALESLVDLDEEAARAVAQRDDDVDHDYHALFTEMIEAMRLDPETVERGTRLILAAHWIERIGDRVTNIAEDVVYLASGDIEDLN